MSDFVVPDRPILKDGVLI